MRLRVVVGCIIAMLVLIVSAQSWATPVSSNGRTRESKTNGARSDSVSSETPSVTPATRSLAVNRTAGQTRNAAGQRSAGLPKARSGQQDDDAPSVEFLLKAAVKGNWVSIDNDGNFGFDCYPNGEGDCPFGTGRTGVQGTVGVHGPLEFEKTVSVGSP